MRSRTVDLFFARDSLVMASLVRGSASCLLDQESWDKRNRGNGCYVCEAVVESKCFDNVGEDDA